MLNENLCAFLQPAPTSTNPDAWRDVCQGQQDIRAAGARFSVYLDLPPGLYAGRIETRDHAFDMRTAMAPLLRFPDGQRMLTGPWDLDHFRNVMAMPMARVCVNGHLLGGLWFDMPGPDRIAAGNLAAEFGFEIETQGLTELVLEFIERDAERLQWKNMRSIVIRRDDRRLMPLTPRLPGHPRIFVDAGEKNAIRRRVENHALYREIRGAPGANVLIKYGMDCACLLAWLNDDREILAQIRDWILESCRRPSWSGRPDPLIMGGDNDRDIGFKLYDCAMAWEFARNAFGPDEQETVLAKVGEYLGKLYDFTVLQRAYMGCPTTDPHSLGAWSGVAIAAMAFYDDLPIARKALPLFHGLYVDSLRLFPPGGKTIWATFYPRFLAVYLAAAHTFGGRRPELEQSDYLDRLGQTLMACYETPSTQELQRGNRTVEHRMIAAILCAFHHTPGIESIYRSFVEKEQELSGAVFPTFFDLLYGPDATAAETVLFGRQPWYLRDIGEIIGVAYAERKLAVSFVSGLRRGGLASFRTMPHNREADLKPGAIEALVDGVPVLSNLSGGYTYIDVNNNILCPSSGGTRINGQYLVGDLDPQYSPAIVRCLIGERFIYAHALLTDMFQPALRLESVERILVMDLAHGSVLIQDRFAGAIPLDWGSHLICSGSVYALGERAFRLTGGQERTIAALWRSPNKGADVSDGEKGELFVESLPTDVETRVTIDEPYWFPSYTYGVNFTGREELRDGHIPRFKRWRLGCANLVARGTLAYAFGLHPSSVVALEDGGIKFSEGAIVKLAGASGANSMAGLAWRAEAVIEDANAKTCLLLGARCVQRPGAWSMRFEAPVDIEMRTGHQGVEGVIFAPSARAVTDASGVTLGKWINDAYHAKSHQHWSTQFSAISQGSR